MRYHNNSYLMEVDKVIKGNIQKGTIVLVTAAPPSLGQYFLPGEGLYFCIEERQDGDSTVANTNSKSLDFYYSQTMLNGEFKNDNESNIIRYFPTIAEFYNYLSANYGVKFDNK
jgi:hypothetical protein